MKVRTSWILGGHERIFGQEKTSVMIEWAGLELFAALPLTHNEKGCSLSDRFSTTTATLPSGLRKAVVIKSSVIEELVIRLAPGRINLEN